MIIHIDLVFGIADRTPGFQDLIWKII